MHVLHVNLGFVEAPSGQDLVARLPAASRLCEAIAAQDGIRVTQLARFWRDEDFVDRGVHYRLRADRLGTLVARPWTRPRALYRLAHELQPDVLHIYGLAFPVQTAGFRRAIGSSTPLVVQPRGARVGRGRSWVAQRWICATADALFLTAAEQARPWREAGIAGLHLAVFEVADASTDFVPVPRADARVAVGVSASPLILWVARLHPRKQPLDGLDGARRALERLPDARLVVIGDGPLRPAIDAWRREHPLLAGRIDLAGHLPHDVLPAWYSAADLFLSSSPEEGSNWALMEALACGALPVCTDIPSHRRLTGGGRFGELWPVGDVARCAEAIVRAADRVVHGAGETPDLRSRLRDHFDANLSWKAVARDSVAAYHTLLARRDRR